MASHHTASRVVAWGGAVTFAAALLYFLFSYAITFGEIVEGRTGAREILINIGLVGSPGTELEFAL